MKKLFFIGFMALGAANADLIPNLQMQPAGVTCSADAGVQSVSGQQTGQRCTWSYDVHLSQFSQLKPGGDGDEFVVIFDFDGYIDNSITGPAGWTASVQNLGPVAPYQNVTGLDSDVTNLVWTYTGSSTLVGAQTWPGFTAQSVFSEQTRGYYNAATWKEGDDDDVQGNTGPTRVPTMGPGGGGEVPEPMSMMLFGGGLAGLGLLRLRKK